MSVQGRTKAVAIAVPLIILTALIILFFNKMALSNLILARGDTFLYFYPNWHAAAQALAEMRIPFWNPAIFMGVPLFANSQAGFLYPLNWPLWLLFETPYAVSASILLHIFIAGTGTYLAARRVLSLSPSAALVAAVSFAFSGYLTAQVEHINQLQGLAWLPWFLLVIGSFGPDAKSTWLRTTLLAGALFCLQLLAGHTQTTFITGVALIIWLFFDWLGRRTRPTAADGAGLDSGTHFKSLLALIVGGLLALALAAVQLAPTLELMRYSSRQGGLPANEVMSFSLPPLLLTRALLPAYGQSLFTEYVAFFPLVILAFAFIGGWQWRRCQGVLPAMAWTLSGLFLAFGVYNPVYWILARLPGFSFFRAPARWLVLFTLGLSLLAGVGWHLLWNWAGIELDAQARRDVLRHRIGPPLLAFLVVLGLLALWGFAAGYFVDLIPLGPEAPFERPSTTVVGGWILEALLLVVLLFAVFYSSSSKIRRFFLILLLILGLISGFLASRTLPYNNLTTPEAYLDVRPSTSRLMAAGGDPPYRMLSLSNIFFDPGDQGEIDSIYNDQLSEQARYDYTIAIKQKEINAPNLPMIYGLASVDGFDGGILPLQAYSQLTAELLLAGQETTDGRLREYLDAVPEARWLDLFNARYLITDKTGDLWRDGVFFDRQHPVDLADGGAVSVSYLPDFEATEIRLLASAKPEAIRVETQSGDSWLLGIEPAGENLYQAPFPNPATLVEAVVEPCLEEEVCILEGLTLVDTRDETFHALVPGNYRLIHSGDVKIYENSDVLERAFIVSDWQWVPGMRESINVLLDPEFDARTTAVLVGDPQGSLPPGNRSPVVDPGRATIEVYGSEQIIIETDNSSDAILVLTDTYYPGWRATVDGEPVVIYQADGLFRGIPIPAGKHEVIFQYESIAYRAGLIGFISTLVIIVLVIIGYSVYRRRNS